MVPSPAVYKGLLYMVKNGGILTSLDARTGKRTRRGRIPGRGNYYASLVAGDGKIFACNEAGVMSIIKAGKTTTSWKLTGKADTTTEANESIVVDVTSVTNATEKGTQKKTLTLVNVCLLYTSPSPRDRG